MYLCGGQILVTFPTQQSGTTAIAAWYDGSGRLLDVRTAPVSGDAVTLANAAPEDAAALGVFVLNESNAPVYASLRMAL